MIGQYFTFSPKVTMYFFLKYIVTLFYKKLRMKILVCLLRESRGPRFVNSLPLRKNQWAAGQAVVVICMP